MFGRTGRQAMRKRTALRNRRCKYTHCLLALTLAFASSLVTFSITVYVTSDYFFEFISYIFSPESKNTRFGQIVANLVEYYQPRDFAGKARSVNFDYYIKYRDFNYLKPETLTYKSRTYPNNIEVLFRRPKRTPITALLLIFHACRHSAYDWFHTTERQRIIGAAIDHGYVCLVFQSTDKNSQCWSNVADIYENKDVQMVLKGLEGFYKDYPGLVSLPRFTFGSSSGGIFSSIFVINQLYEIQGQILFNSIILPEILHTYVKTKNYPKTAWIHMLRDIEFASEDRINISQQIFIEQKIPYKTFPIEPIALSHATFSQRIPSITTETSRYIFHRIKKYHWLNSYNYLRYNPRRDDEWEEFLFAPPTDIKYEEIFNNLNKSRNIIIEFLNTVYGEHEISYERSFEALKWIKESPITSDNLNNSKT